MFLQHVAHLLRRVPEVAGELDFLVADGRDLRERAVEVLFEVGPHGVELHADTLDRCGERGTEGQRRRAERSEKSASVQGGHGVRV